MKKADHPWSAPSFRILVCLLAVLTLKLRFHRDRFAQMELRVLDLLDRGSLRDLRRRQKLAEGHFHRVGQGVNRLMLRPQVAALIGAAHAQWDEMVDFEIGALHALDRETERLVVRLNDRILRAGADATIAILDVLWIAIRISRGAEDTGRDGQVGLDRIGTVLRRGGIGIEGHGSLGRGATGGDGQTKAGEHWEREACHRVLIDEHYGAR